MKAKNRSAKRSVNKSMTKVKTTNRNADVNGVNQHDTSLRNTNRRNTNLHGVFTLVLALVFGSTFVAACGGGQRTRTEVPSDIAEIRDRAASNPDDPMAQRELAFAELFHPDGEPIAAASAIEQARAFDSSESDIELRFVEALEQHLHGHPAAALEAFVSILESGAAGTFDVEADEAGEAHTNVDRFLELSAEGLIELDGEAPNFDHVIRTRLEGVVDSLPPAARFSLTTTLIELFARAGDTDMIHSLTERTGCVADWRVAGPIGPRDLLSFDEVHAIEGPGAMPAEVDLGEGRGVRLVRDFPRSGCTVNLGGGQLGLGGTTIAESFFQVDPSSSRRVLRVETPNAIELRIDGNLVVRRDPRRDVLRRVSFHEVNLAPGEHEIEVKLASRHPNPVLSVALIPAQDEAIDTIDAAPLSELERAPSQSASERSFLCYRAATSHLSRGRVADALMVLRQRGCSDAVPNQILKASVLLSDEMTPADVRRDGARALYRQAQNRDPNAFFPPLSLAQLQAAEGQDLEAMTAIRAHMDAFPEVVSFPLSLAELLMGRAWYGEVPELIERAKAVAPGVCPPIRLAFSFARQRDRTPEAHAHLEDVMTCDARSADRFSMLLSARRWDEASAELERLIAQAPPSYRTRFLLSQLEVAEGSGNEAQIDQVYAELRALQPRSLLAARGWVDTLALRGQQQRAINAATEILDDEPAAMSELRSSRVVLGGPDDLAPFFVDGEGVIEAFETFIEAHPEQYEEPQVLVFDYTAIKVFDDLSSVALTHQIYRAQAEESVDDLGQYEPPSDGYVLLARTIKADGTILEPDHIDNMSSITLPQVEPGDYVEVQSVRYLYPPDGLAGGVLGERFYFANPDTPFHHSELVLATPANLPITIDSRGPEVALTTERESLLGKPYVLRRWLAQEVPGLVFEPASINSREYLPSINWAVNATWPGFLEGLRDVLVDRDPRELRAETLVREILGPNARELSDEEKARTIYRWVLFNVEDTNNFFGVAPVMLASRAGNRARVLHYLFQLADVPSELVLVRDLSADQTRSDVADEGTYQNLLVRLPTIGGERERSQGGTLVMTGARFSPFGYVSPVIHGQDAIVLTPFDSPSEVRRFEVAEAEPGSARHAIEAVMTLHGDDATVLVDVVETIVGSDAIQWRASLATIPEPLREGRFEEGYLAGLVPGAALESLRVQNLESPDSPLVLRYRFAAPLVREVELDTNSADSNSADSNSAAHSNSDSSSPTVSAREVLAFFPANLAPQVAPLAERETTQIVGPPVDLEVTVTIRGGGDVLSLPSNVDLAGPAAPLHFSQNAREENGAVVVERALRLPLTRVTPQEYAAFVEWVQAVDRAEAELVRLR